MRLTIDHNDPLLELKFISYMIHPGDDVKREEFHAVMLAEKTLENDAKVVSDPFSMLVSAGRKEVIRGLNLSIDRGIMAGNVLLYVIQMQYHGIADAGLDKAAYMTSRYLHERDKLGDGVYVAGRDTVNQKEERRVG